MTLFQDRRSENNIVLLLPFLLGLFNPDGETRGLLSRGCAISQFAATPLLGALSDRIRSRPGIAICVVGSVLACWRFTTLILLLAARLINGVSDRTDFTSGDVQANIPPPDQWARAFSLFGW